jgi:hypothetical protein
MRKGRPPASMWEIPMTSASQPMERKRRFHVRPVFLLSCLVFLLVVFLPGALWNKPPAQRTLLGLATVAILSGWFFLLLRPESNSRWRSVIALVASIYLTMSLPAFAYELSPFYWALHHRAPLFYIWPLVHWGYALTLFGLVGSFFGRGRPRIAFVVAGTVLMIIRLAGHWLL